MAAIHAIYPATEGEGVRIGIPQLFIRFQGCAIGCKNCDSKETWDFAEATNLTIAEIIDQVKSYGLSWTSITGGDPLHPRHRQDLIALISSLHSIGQKINIEASGQQLVTDIFSEVDFISFDIKTPSTGVSIDIALVDSFLEQFGHKAQIKLVVASKQDFAFAYSLFTNLQHYAKCPHWVITPASSVESPLDLSLFEWILEQNQQRGARFRIIGQQHKWVFGVDRVDI